MVSDLIQSARNNHYDGSMLPKSRQRSGPMVSGWIKGANHSADGFDVAKESTTIGSDGFGLDSIKGAKHSGPMASMLPKSFTTIGVRWLLLVQSKVKHSNDGFDGR
jgi:hypothetical protein